MPVARDVADQIGAIDALRELTLDVIAALDLNAAYIRSGWRINFGPDEETALDQLWHRRAFHQHLEDVAEAAPIPTTRGCRDPDHRLAGAGRRYHEEAAITCGNSGVDALDDLGLVRPQCGRGHGARRSSRLTFSTPGKRERNRREYRARTRLFGLGCSAGPGEA